MYRIAENLAVWWYMYALKSGNIVHMHMAIPYHTTEFESANSVQYIFGAKPPNLMPANISGYIMVYVCTVVSRKRAHYGLSAHPPVLPQFPAKV